MNAFGRALVVLLIALLATPAWAQRVSDGTAQHVIVDTCVSGCAGSGGGAGDASAANQLLGNASLASLDTKLTTPLPVSGSITFLNTSIGVTHANFANLDAALSTLATAAKQPTLVSGRMPVDGSGITQPVSGTFWQATQPVSGTFWQATQPVSGTVTTTPPSNASTNVTQWAGTALDVNSGTKSAGTLRVVLATDQPALTNKLLVTPDSVALPANQSVNVNQLAGTATSVNSGTKDAGTLRVVLATDQPALTNKLLVTPDSVALPANQSVNVNQFGGSAAVTGTGASGSGVPRVTVANDSNVIITPPTLTKATQGSTGFSTQDLKDAGRTAFQYYAVAAAAGTTGTETLITLTKSSGTSATSTGTSFVPTSAKRFRITELSIATRGNATATIQTTTFNLRINTAGACLVSSTPIVFSARSATPATASAWDRYIIPIPDGYEIAGDGTLAFCVSANATYVTNAPTWDVNLIGYEY
jgi:hypothetical protein